MGMLKGRTREENLTGYLYGKYSFGSMYDMLLSEERLEHSKQVVEDDLRIAGVLHKLPEMRMMDVGTGRQALSMALLGAGQVDHYDISKAHVERFGRLLNERHPGLPVSTNNLDLCVGELPRDHYDFVYLAGIVHHFSNPATGLLNCARAVKPGGRLWCYFYRSGTFKWFVTEMIRRLLSADDLDTYFYASAQLYGAGKVDSPVTSQIMDDFFAPYIFLFPPQDYLRFMNQLGFDLCSTSHADPMAACNHDLCHHSAVLVFERTRELDMTAVDTKTLLRPEGEVDQLDKSLYADEQSRELIDLYEAVRSLFSERDDAVMRFGLCLAMHRVGAPQYYGEQALPPRRAELRTLLENARDYLRNR